MAKFNSLVWTTLIGASLTVGSIVSCTVSESTDDESAGAGGEDAEAGGPSSGTGGTTGGGGTTSEGGASGETSAGAGAGGAEGGASGASGAGGAFSGNVCDGAAAGGAGAGGQSSAEGKTCTDYCAAFYTSCADYADDAAFRSEADCRAVCENFLDEQLCCRTHHVLRAAAPGASVATECASAAGAIGGECN